MKKFKKVLLSVALCLCLGFTAICATACSGVNLSEEQTQKLLDAVDHSDQFMNDTLDLLQKSNSKMDREDAYLMLKSALIRLETNADGDWDNLKLNVTQTQDGYNNEPAEIEIGIYKLSDEYSSRRAAYYDVVGTGYKFAGIEGKLNTESQEQEQLVPAAYNPTYIRVDGSHQTSNTEKNSIQRLIQNECLSSIGIFAIDIIVDDIVEFKRLDSGNCVISIATIPEQYKDDDCSCYIEFELNSEGKIVSEKMSVYMLISMPSFESVTYYGQLITCDVTLTYGALVESEVVETLENWGADFSQIA